MPDFLRNRRRNATHLRPRVSLVMRAVGTLMVCDAINVFCEGTVTFVGTTFTVVRRASEIVPSLSGERG